MILWTLLCVCVCVCVIATVKHIAINEQKRDYFAEL